MEYQIFEIVKELAMSIGANFIYDVNSNIVKLLLHQESNLTKWLIFLHPTEKDIELIKSNSHIKRIISIFFEKIENEIFEEKLFFGEKITYCVIQNQRQSYSNDLHFIKLFSDMSLSVIIYLFNISKKEQIDLVDQYLKDNNAQEQYSCENYCIGLSLIEVFSTGNPVPTEFGKQFLDFIGEEYQKIC